LLCRAIRPFPATKSTKITLIHDDGGRFHSREMETSDQIVSLDSIDGNGNLKVSFLRSNGSYLGALQLVFTVLMHHVGTNPTNIDPISTNATYIQGSEKIRLAPATWVRNIMEITSKLK
jgi:hypothetical protein